MSQRIKETALRYERAGLSVLPAKADKRPALSSWVPLSSTALTPAEIEQLFNRERIRPEYVPKSSRTNQSGVVLTTTPQALAIITGESSGSLEVIDVDAKYDLTGRLWTDLWSRIEQALPALSQQLLTAQTKSGGYHIYYRCSEIAGNKKLAQRPANEAEQANGDKVLVLLETRGQGGYVIAPPSPGYSYLQATPEAIPTITPEQRATLFEICHSFDQMPEEKKQAPALAAAKPVRLPRATGSAAAADPFQDYNERGDVIGLLKEHGWTEVGSDQERVLMLRPGDSSAAYSANYHKESKRFIVWSESTQFEAFNRSSGTPAYSPADVFKELQAGGDTKRAAEMLEEAGYGEQLKPFEPPENDPEPPPPAQPKQKPEPASTMPQGQVNEVSGVTNVYSINTKTGETQDIDRRALSAGLAGTAEEQLYIEVAGPGIRRKIEALIKDLQDYKGGIFIEQAGEEPRYYYSYLKDSITQEYRELGESREENYLQDNETDQLLRDLVNLGGLLKPLDLDIYREELLSDETIQDLGITKESWDATITALRTDHAKEQQRRQTEQLLNKATNTLRSGEPKKALSELEQGLRSAKTTDQRAHFEELLRQPTRAEVLKAIQEKPPVLQTGLKIGDTGQQEVYELNIPAGALSVWAAPTSHGKTMLLINAALRAAQLNPGKRFYLFSYEEAREPILLKTLNAYQGRTLSRNNIRSIESYFRGEQGYINLAERDQFRKTERAFWEELISTGRLNIIYSSMDSDSLCNMIHYLKENQTDVGGIFVDYFQLLNLPEERMKNYGSRQQELKEICQNLKDTAVDTGLPVALAAQFNREVDAPQHIHATRIGEAGDIERIANTILGIWNTRFRAALDAQGSKTQKAEEYIGNEVALGRSEKLYVEVLKNRDGKAGLRGLFNLDGNAGQIATDRNRVIQEAEENKEALSGQAPGEPDAEESFF